MAMREVSKKSFFEVIGPMNVHPRPEPDHTEWLCQITRQVVGRTEPGYKNSLNKPKRYWLEQTFVR
jgi:hypothetical protein